MSKIDEIRKIIFNQTQQESEQSRRKWRTYKENPLLFSALIVSGFLSHLSGWFIGLGVSITNGEVSYTLDIPHLFVAILYACLFPYFFEFGLANWLDKYLKREQNFKDKIKTENTAQKISAGIMVFITGLGTFLTAFSASDIIATTLGFFDSFTEIPVEVQRYMVFSLPFMLAVNVLFGEIYRQNSEQAVLVRAAQMEINARRTDADLEMEIAKIDAEAQISIEASKVYSERAKNESKGIGQNRGNKDWEDNKKKLSYANDTDFTQGKDSKS